MALIKIVDEKRTLDDAQEVVAYLAGLGIEYERWQPTHPVPKDASADEVLAAYAEEIDRLKAKGGYVTADVIDVHAQTPGLDAMLAKFRREHWHDEDEVRFIIEGRGIFHFHPPHGPVLALEVAPGDLIRVPKGTWHWFDLCGDKRIRAIRLFKDPAGWAPRYTDSGVDASYEPVCWGPSYIPR
jgi:1,2-dihydroxy-3-keto-5-methylthiopentene dioxygenase